VFATGKDKVASVIDAHLATTEQTCAAEAAADCPQLAISEVDEWTQIRPGRRLAPHLRPRQPSGASQPA
jgi:hypothetical protein